MKKHDFYPRAAGVLLPVTMLSGPFGIGTLGKEARIFIDFLVSCGFHGWQVLPVESTGSCFSPYNCISAFAGEPMLIDPYMLLDMELVSHDDINERMNGISEDFVDYPKVLEKQWALLQKAYACALHKCAPDGVGELPHNNFTKPWLENYALYMAIKERFDGEPWQKWPQELRDFEKSAIKAAKIKLSKEIDFFKFVQWLFDKAWTDVKSYANSREIQIIGDLPFYVSEDSVEVWSQRELFEVNSDGSFAAVGGAPPDYYNPEGQLWGNPVYDLKKMKSEGYKWWVARMRAALSRYDVVRLDHFRGFERYWRIPADALTAIDGKWVKGPGAALFKALYEKFGDLPIIAEDLGTIDEKVDALRNKFGLRGMKVLQFANASDDIHLPHNYTGDTVAFTGTHDNTTLFAWHGGLDDETRNWAADYVGFEGDLNAGGPNCAINKAWIRMLYMSGASLVIIPIQDLLGYGADTRTNIPGTKAGNWRFRIRSGALSEIDSGYYYHLGKLAFRQCLPSLTKK